MAYITWIWLPAAPVLALWSAVTAGVIIVALLWERQQRPGRSRTPGAVPPPTHWTRG